MGKKNKYNTRKKRNNFYPNAFNKVGVSKH